MTNAFPDIWFDTYLRPEHAAPVDRELAFIQNYLPVSTYPRILDLPCGIGRHSGPLAELGYQIVGADRSETALSVARSQWSAVEFVKLDMFELGSLGRSFDAVICLWQSFGYGDSAQNRAVLRSMRQVLRLGGRILLDIYNADAVAQLPSDSVETRRGRTVRTRRTLEHHRLRVELEYSDVSEVDRHEWEIYNPADIEQLAADSGLDVLLSCAWFDPAVAPSKDHLRMQLLLERKS